MLMGAALSPLPLVWLLLPLAEALLSPLPPLSLPLLELPLVRARLATPRLLGSA